jgi:hypothetical protein
MIVDLRYRAGRQFALWIVHHENKAGDVSGAWERLPDTLVHVSARGNGRTRVHWRKVRWSSRLHDTTTELLWDNGGFKVEEKVERDLSAELQVAFGKENVWRTVREAAGLIAANQDRVRDVLHELRENGRVVYQQGPPGRSSNAKCWRLRTDSDPPESHRVTRPVKGAPEVTDSLTRPTNESVEADHSTHPHLTDSDSAESDDLTWT